MKNYIVCACFISAALCMSFTSDNAVFENSSVIEIKLPENLKTGDWSQWETTSCFKGLDYRVVNRGLNYDKTEYKWGVQFRNRYLTKIFFSYEVYDNKPASPRTTNRTDLDTDEISEGYRDFYMQNGNSIYVYVDEVRFTSDYGEYSNCDK